MIGRIVLSMFLVFGPCAAPVNAQVIDYKQGDPEMDAAITAAVRSLPLFSDALARRTAEDFNLKVPLPQQNGRELIWMNEVSRDGEHFIGRIANTPIDQRVRRGERYRVPKSEIVDWYFMREGKMHGSYTTRVMLKRMPPEQAERLRAILAPLP